ncbi:MAG: hypothetical protein LBU75_01330 [Desulfovibrio sp.]|jgi:hypothetical protein|nr:hypothetical protein [Desulfovibrio sp.]
MRRRSRAFRGLARILLLVVACAVSAPAAPGLCGPAATPPPRNVPDKPFSDTRSGRSLSEPDDWSRMATATALRVYKALDDRRDLVALPIRISPPNARPFALAYQNLLATELVSRGMQVTLAPEDDSVELDFAVHAVPVGAQRPVSEAAASPDAKWEVVLTTTMWHGNRYVIHAADGFVVRGDELGKYVDPDAPGHTVRPFRTRSVPMVNR